jgi:hypothetical protein
VGAELLFDLDLAEAGAMSAYVSSDEIDEVRDALRQGIAVVVVATKLKIPPRELAAVLGIPEKPAKWPEPAEDEVDLWAGCDRLERLL